MKKIVPEFQFSPRETETIKELSLELNVSETLAGILFARGCDTAEKMRTFLNPSAKNFLSPFLMRGMKEAKELITRARDEGWRVAVFGDYDADGIGALSILYRALKEFGIEAYLHAPERIDGYGMSIAAIDKIFDEFLPDLFITVDCGISCAQEVEYIKEQGAYVIVTDHHELPEVLPDCIVINPKLKDDYPYDNLAGAGVAFKLATALIGEKANDLLDFCALSTVADSVPLLGENRDIVAEGLKRMRVNPRPAFQALLGNNASDVSAQTISFTISPRLNAAGRLGDVASSLRLFVSDDEDEIYALAAKLNEYNIQRQKCSDQLQSEANDIVRMRDANKQVIMACAESGNGGVVGLVAGRLVEEFSRPCLLFVKKGDKYRGSARSIEEVNIYEALCACSEYIEAFGGHSQAAGVTITEENFEKLEEMLSNYLARHYQAEDFVPKIPVVGEIKENLLEFAKELDLLEPCGVGNRRPVFVYHAGAMRTAPMNAQARHLFVSDTNMEFSYFSGSKHKPILESSIDKDLVFELTLSHYRGKEQAKAVLRTIAYDARRSDKVDAEIFENNLLSLSRNHLGGKADEYLSEEELHALVQKLLKENLYGTCYIAHSLDTLKAFLELNLHAEIFCPVSGGQNTLLLSPTQDADFECFSRLVYLDAPRFFPASLRGQTVYCNRERSGYEAMKKLTADRESLSKIFVAVRAQSHAVRGTTPLKAAQSCNALGFDFEQFVFALAVFAELGLIKLTNEGLFIQRGVKRELTESAIFCAVLGLSEA